MMSWLGHQSNMRLAGWLHELGSQQAIQPRRLSGLIEQNKKRPRRRLVQAPGPLYPSVLDGPKLRERYSIPNALNRGVD